MEKFPGDIAGFDMIYDDFKDFCRRAWEGEDYIFFFRLRHEKKNGGKGGIRNESRPKTFP